MPSYKALWNHPDKNKQTADKRNSTIPGYTDLRMILRIYQYQMQGFPPWAKARLTRAGGSAKVPGRQCCVTLPFHHNCTLNSVSCERATNVASPRATHLLKQQRVQPTLLMYGPPDHAGPYGRLRLFRF